MSASFGVYIGSSTACVAVCRDGKSQVIANDLGDRVTPACVGFFGNDTSVGLAAKQNAQKNASNTIMGVKRIIGKNFSRDADEIQKYISKSSVKVIKDQDVPVFQVTINDKPTQFRPIEVAGLIYKNLMATAKSHGCQSKTYEAVLTVPYYFNDIERAAIGKAAESVGFTVMRIINECSAGLLAYDIGQNDASLSCNALLFRVGGQSMDVSVVTVTNGMYRVVAHRHDDSLGGIVIDDALVEFLVGEFKRQSRLDCSKNERSLTKLRLAAETCKHALSTLPSSNCTVESLFEGVDFSCNISRSRLDALSTSFVQSCLSIVEQLVTMETELKLEDINKVVIFGGVSKMPLLQQKLQDLLSSAEFFNSIPPDEVVAVGAAYQAAILSGKGSSEWESLDIPCLLSDIFIEVAEGKKSILFHKKTPIPFRRKLTFNVNGEENKFLLHLLQHESATNETQTLLKMTVSGHLPDNLVNIIFHFKHDGSLHLTCSDASGCHLSDVALDSSRKPSSPLKNSQANLIDGASSPLAEKSE